MKATKTWRTERGTLILTTEVEVDGRVLRADTAIESVYALSTGPFGYVERRQEDEILAVLRKELFGR